MEKINISKNTFAVIPDNLYYSDNTFNMIFQFRWMSSAKPDLKSHIKAVVIYGDSGLLNSGNTEELGSPIYINKAVDKILNHLKTTNPQAKLKNLGFSGYSGGGIAIYHLINKFELLQIKPNAIILSDANYGGKATSPVWVKAAKLALNNEMRLILLHTSSLKNRFDSTTQTTKDMLKKLNLNYSAPITDAGKEFWGISIEAEVNKNELHIISTNNTHADAGKMVPHLWNYYLADWDVEFL